MRPCVDKHKRGLIRGSGSHDTRGQIVSIRTLGVFEEREVLRFGGTAGLKGAGGAVPYTPPTLPTIYPVEIPLVALS